jgi:cytochrome c oxidase assembly protein subunit 11
MLGKLVVVALMFGFGYALVPMYRAICDALGINVLSCRSSAPRELAAAPGRGNTQVDTSRTDHGRVRRQCARPWDFKPAQPSVQVHPGELATVMYEFRNVQNRTMAAQAIPSYAPMQAGRTSTSSSASASTSTRWRRARQGSGRWSSSSTPSCRRT